MGNVLGKNLRALRKKFGITQQELAEIAHVSRETVNKWESGTIGNIRAANLNSIIGHFGLSTDDLRSESRGLAAQMMGTQTEAVPSMVPLIRPIDLEYRSDSSQGQKEAGAHRYVPLPDVLWQGHPNAFAIEMDSSDMSRVLPQGGHVIVDPDLQATSGSLVLAAIHTGGDASSFIVRRLHLGTTTALLSAEAYGEEIEDVVMRIEDLDVLGTIVWYQPAGELH